MCSSESRCRFNSNADSGKNLTGDPHHFGLLLYLERGGKAGCLRWSQRSFQTETAGGVNGTRSKHKEGKKMKSKQLVMALVTLAVVFATAGHAFADCQKRVDLNPTGAGAAINAKADARVRQVGDRQKLTVEMDDNVAKGTTITVSVAIANGSYGPGWSFTIDVSYAGI